MSGECFRIRNGGMAIPRTYLLFGIFSMGALKCGNNSDLVHRGTRVFLRYSVSITPAIVAAAQQTQIQHYRDNHHDHERGIVRHPLVEHVGVGDQSQRQKDKPKQRNQQIVREVREEVREKIEQKNRDAREKNDEQRQ